MTNLVRTVINCPDMYILLFDVDNTLYPKDCGLFKEVDKRINLYIKKYLNLKDFSEINLLRKTYLQKYGTTLNGLMKHHNVDPIDYLEFVHQVNLEKYILKNEKLKTFLANSPYKKVIFSNAYAPYILKILNLLDIRKYFCKIFDIVSIDYIPKPLPEPYIKISKMFKEKTYKFIMIDDSIPNLLTAKNLGMKTIYIKNNKKDIPDFDLCLNYIDEISRINTSSKFIVQL